MVVVSNAQTSGGWPSDYDGVMLQGFYWDSFKNASGDETWGTWDGIAAQADELGQYFSLIWIPQSARTPTYPNSMGYDPLYFFNQSSSWGNKSQLMNMVQTLKAKNVGVIGDVVINHHGTNSGWFGFPAEKYNGVTYQLKSTDVVKNDDGGKAATEAARLGVSLSANNDEGEDWAGQRDLDHKSANVQTVIKAYQQMLVNEIGLAGFRYDMVKGFAASHVGDYNDAAGVQFSVGEYWDSNSAIENWINATGKRSAAFDFQFKYNVRDAINNNSWAYLNSVNNLMHDAAYRRYAVTFVENHDTEIRPDGSSSDPLRRDTLAANAHMLSMPGTPCVFLKHWIARKEAIKSMIEIRKEAGITNTSNYTNQQANASYVVNAVEGKNGTLLAVIGKQTYNPATDPKVNGSSWVKVLSGYHFSYYMKKDANSGQAYIDLVSGEYRSDQKATLNTRSTAADTKIAYTLDGTEPSATNGTQVYPGSTVSILKANGEQVLKAVLIINGAVSGKVVSRTYTFSSFKPYDIKIYVNADNAGTAWAAAQSTATSPYINYWTWGGDGSHAPTQGSWPGDKVTTTESVNGKTWFVKTFTINSEDDCVSFVFSIGSGTPQTVNIEDVNKNAYYEISSDKETSSGNYLVNDVTTANGIDAVKTDARPNNDPYYYTISGARTLNPTQKGIYIHQGKKIVIR